MLLTDVTASSCVVGRTRASKRVDQISTGARDAGGTGTLVDVCITITRYSSHSAKAIDVSVFTSLVVHAQDNALKSVKFNTCTKFS